MISYPKKQALVTWCVPIILVALCAVPLYGQTAWNTTVTNGFFDDVLNWTNGIPDASTATNYNVASDTLVTLRQNEASGVTGFWSSSASPVPAVGSSMTLTIDLGAHDYTAGNAGTNVFRPPSSVDYTRRLVFTGEKDIDGQNLGLFVLSGTTDAYWAHTGNSAQGHTETILQSGVTFRFDGTLALQWGRTFTSTLLFEVEEGARLELTNSGRSFIIANSDGNDAELRVSGGVTTHAGPLVRIANSGDKHATSDRGGGDGRLTVTDGGSFTTAGAIQAGFAIDSRAYIRVEGADSVINAAKAFIGGTAIDTGRGTATASFLDGGTGNFDDLYVFYTVHAPELEQDPTWGTVIVDGGHVAVEGVALFQPSSVLGITINDVSQAFAISASSLTVTDAILLLSLGDGFIAAIDDTILLLEYTDSLIGSFAGFSEGQTFSIDDYTFQFSYLMNDSSAIGLTVIPEPGTLAFVTTILVGSFLLVRRKYT